MQYGVLESLYLYGWYDFQIDCLKVVLLFHYRSLSDDDLILNLMFSTLSFIL